LKALDVATGGLTTVCADSNYTKGSGTGVKFSLLNENAGSFKDPKGCDYNYKSGTREVVIAVITTGGTGTMTEQRFEVSTYKEGGTAGDKITG
jgi:hypothetical protein